MATPTTEFIFLPVKSSVRPEEESSIEGKAFLELLSSKKHSVDDLIWGPCVDRPDIVCIGAGKFSPVVVGQQFTGHHLMEVELSEPLELPAGNHRFDVVALQPFQSSPPSTIVVRAKASDFVSNPVTEIAILPLEDNLSKDELASLSTSSAVFGNALLTTPAPSKYTGKMALTYKSSWAEGPPKNNVLVMMIGWREVQNHLDAATTEVFKDNLQPIQDRVFGELDVKHFSFKQV